MKKEILVGDEFTVDFIKNEKGGKPVCRVNGFVGFIDRSVKDFVTPSSSWIVRVSEIHETYVIVQPLVKVRTPKDNTIIMNQKLQDLKQQQEQKEHHEKPKKGYQYRSFQELQQVKNDKLKNE